MTTYPQSALLAQVAVLVFVCMIQPEAYSAMLTFCARLTAAASLLAMAFVALFCVAVLSLDMAYVFVRLALPEAKVWTEGARPLWVLAWIMTWLLQVPFWMQAFPASSPLLVHELANFALNLHHVVLRYVRPVSSVLSFPSASLVASTDSTQHADLATVVAARTSLPLVYVLCHGAPAEWRLVLLLFALDVVPAMIASCASWLGLCGRRSQVAQLHWRLRYPDAHDNEIHGPIDDDECDVHGSCPICLSSLCCTGGGLATAAVSRALRSQVAPSISVLRRPHAGRGFLRGPSLSIARSPAEWGGAGRIATTRCGHSFHSHCLSVAAQTLPRCPQCRSSILKAEAPDEETADRQMLCLSFGMLLGLFLLALQVGVLAWQRYQQEGGDLSKLLSAATSS